MTRNHNQLQKFTITHQPNLLISSTDGQSGSLSWNKAPIWGLRPDCYYCQTVAGLLMWGALSDERTGLSFTIDAGARQRHIYVSDSRLPFALPPTTRRVTVQLFEPASTRVTDLLLQTVLLITFRHGPHRKHRSSIAFVFVAAGTCLPSRCGGNHRKHRFSIACVYVVGFTWQRPLFTESPLKNGSICHNMHVCVCVCVFLT
jgi:hypothetical protein